MTRTPVVHVVDDDESLRRALSRRLASAGYEVRTYARAADFLDAGPCEAPGCIILDIHMPVMGGLELQEALAARAGSLPVVFLTGHQDAYTRRIATRAGVLELLMKPVSSQSLLSAVRQAVARSSAAASAKPGPNDEG